MYFFAHDCKYLNLITLLILQPSFFTRQRGKSILKWTGIITAFVYVFSVYIPQKKRNEARNAYLEGIVLAQRQPDKDTISSHSKPIPEQENSSSRSDNSE